MTSSVNPNDVWIAVIRVTISATQPVSSSLHQPLGSSPSSTNPGISHAQALMTSGTDESRGSVARHQLNGTMACSGTWRRLRECHGLAVGKFGFFKEFNVTTRPVGTLGMIPEMIQVPRKSSGRYLRYGLTARGNNDDILSLLGANWLRREHWESLRRKPGLQNLVKLARQLNAKEPEMLLAA